MTANVSVASIGFAYSGSAAIAIAVASFFGVVGMVHAAEVRHQQDEHLKPTGKGWGEVDPTGLTDANAAKFAKPNNNNGIFYHGGPVMLGSANVYYIWYGNWLNDPTTVILSDFASSIGGSTYFNINTTYYDGAAQSVSGGVVLAGQSTDDKYSQGAALTDSAVQNIVAGAIAGGGLPNDPKGVYFVLTSADVTETSGFCTQYCAWHSHATINGSDIKYGFIGNPNRCPSSCSAQPYGPNGSSGADGMANLIAHELAEAVTDPDLNAWFDRRGFENGDKCAWKFGSTQTAANGSLYNVMFGSRQYLLQQNWVNASGGYCALSYTKQQAAATPR